MIPLIVLAVTFTVLRLFRLEWRRALRYALAAMFFVTATAHWGDKRADLVRMVPPVFPNAELLVTLTGIAEIAGAVGLLFERTSRYTAIGLSILLVAVFPANVYAAQQQLSIGGRPVTGLPLRTAMQVVFIAATVAVWARPRRASRVTG